MTAADGIAVRPHLPRSPSFCLRLSRSLYSALKNYNSHAVRNITIQSSQHRLEGVSADPSVPHLNIVPGGSQQAFQLSRKCLAAPNTEASRVAVPKRNDPDWLGETGGAKSKALNKAAQAIMRVVFIASTSCRKRLRERQNGRLTAKLGDHVLDIRYQLSACSGLVSPPAARCLVRRQNVRAPRRSERVGH